MNKNFINNVIGVDFNIISHLQQQLQSRTKWRWW